jgi:glycosyltransferase involved in cell wall biosynthesis
MDILVACDRIVRSGGLLRFDRIARTIAPHGHCLSFLALGSRDGDRHTEVEVLDLTEAATRQWDAVMIPGAGFPAEIVAQFSLLRKPQFGVRVQHVLNDQTRREAFFRVNAAFDPQIVIFNNEYWPAGSFTEFRADRFHTLLGAVDIRRFCPASGVNASVGQWFVGGLANKNPLPLVTAVAQMKGVVLKLFGHDAYKLAERFPGLVKEGRLILVGVLGEDDLPAFYHSVHCVAMTEQSAGWANLAAEAMASGVPVLCTAHGTTAFAYDGRTALVVEEPSAQALAKGLERLRADHALCSRLVKNARKRIERYDWEAYCASLLRLCNDSKRRDQASHPRRQSTPTRGFDSDPSRVR